MSNSFNADAWVDAALASAGLRRTAATLALARLFARGDEAMLAHAQVEQLLAAEGLKVNRVTLYRLLDRFAAAGLLRRTVDAQRVSRFVRSSQEGGPAPRFECDDCHRQFRLADDSQKLNDAARQVLQVLEAAGHEGHTIDVSVHGRCAGCATDAAPRSAS
ncbi:MAG: transcriptional repressor [Polaromonas sp.]|uniref:Fur family transcriptional regulator n=1 Tax=Polaromonas sp. TaxID=1869339 RepID=UPI002736ED17|nr:transcriptional repressor [Polaromonas sp.]MDP2817696.1 transcriptional repressor [Polaromonas sp.]